VGNSQDGSKNYAIWRIFKRDGFIFMQNYVFELFHFLDLEFFCGLLGMTRGRFLSMISAWAAMAANLDLVSIDYLTNAWVIWSDFFVAYWGRLVKGSFR
jgi:hypothetical protein